MSDTTTTGAATSEAGDTQNAGETQAAETSTLLTTEGTAPAAEGAKEGDGKPADGTTEGDKPADKPADGKPIEYDFKFPKELPLDEQMLGEFKTVAQAMKMPQDQAQKIVDMAVKMQTLSTERHQAAVADWAKAVAADKELGNPENQAVARTAIDKFGTPELKAILNASGLGNHPELVKFALKVGKAISEDRVIIGRGDAPAPNDPASVLYPNQAKA